MPQNQLIRPSLEPVNSFSPGPYSNRVNSRIAGRADVPADLRDSLLSILSEAEHIIAEQQRRISALETLSETDELTGLMNRRGVERFIERAIFAAQRYGDTGAVFVIDLNDFKSVNDTCGHLAGDEVLRAVGGLLRRMSRSSDAVARVGGDEFVVVLPRIAPQHVDARRDALRQAFRQFSVSLPCGPRSVSASVGAQTFDGSPSPSIILRQADTEMYEDKRSHQSTRDGSSNTRGSE